ncbi:MAG: energy-coupling factor transporter transmembrane protein EcfT [Microbacterium sp.]|uniref:energy-coupling factor transporter transmembrane component T family protein n=1 Tax=Microbacterium sp. TaxID=51671 RepID=UPI001DC0A90C|nr:energy-coupling factor transporter transmembrane component T [Microbacterium sp.]MBW8764643.1 energy-coupling factor transporter transmembrane protein EcfT [Microbacterium sp.]
MRRHGVATINPVAKVAASLLIALTLALSVDAASALTALALELAVLPFAGLRWGAFWRRTAAVWIAAPLAGITVALYGRASGHVYLDWLFVHVTDGSLRLAAITAVRVLAIALPAVVLFATVDATEFADGLAQLLRLPARFVLGALAALRLVGLMRDDWQALELARRARGVADRGRVRRLPGLAFALFVLSIRRGSALATAMEARGFGGDGPRTWARPSRFGGREVLLILVGAALAATAVVVAVATGQWVFIAS